MHHNQLNILMRAGNTAPGSQHILGPQTFPKYVASGSGLFMCVYRDALQVAAPRVFFQLPAFLKAGKSDQLKLRYPARGIDRFVYLRGASLLFRGWLPTHTKNMRKLCPKSFRQR